MDQPVIELKGVTYSYNSEPVLDNVDLTVWAGEFLAVLGPNGGGKTTLLKTILGLLRPQKGMVRVFGKDPSQVSERIGYVPQKSNVRPDFPINVLEIVLMGLTDSRRKGFRYSRAEKELALSALEKVEMQPYARRRMDSLSGGQAQRVLIARALVRSPELLVLDEPTSNVDPHGKFCFFELLAALGKSITVVVVSHDISVASARISGVACVNRRLLHNLKPELTPEMLSLLYGEHDHTCPVGVYMRDVSALFGVREINGRAGEDVHAGEKDA